MSVHNFIHVIGAIALFVYTYIQHFMVGNDFADAIFIFYDGVPLGWIQAEEASCDS
jgi:hypothetical protein